MNLDCWRSILRWTWRWLRRTWQRFRRSVAAALMLGRLVSCHSANVSIGSLRLAARLFKPHLYIRAAARIRLLRYDILWRQWLTLSNKILAIYSQLWYSTSHGNKENLKTHS